MPATPDAVSEPAAGAAAPVPEVLIGRQPIVDRAKKLVAFELVFRTEANREAAVANHFAATAKVIADAFTEFGVEKTLGPHRGFLNVDRELLMSNLLALLPSNRIVLELMEGVQPDEAVIKRCKLLRAAGYRLALTDVVVFDERVKRLLPCVNMVKMDLVKIDEPTLRRFASALRRLPLLLVAARVDTPAHAKLCMDLGFELFQGYHFAHPELVTGKRAQPAKLALLRLTKLLSADAEVAEIEDELKQHPDLAYNLMRIVNSAAFGLSRKIDSLTQCIVVLGRVKLTQWVQVLLYAANRAGASSSNPLMQMAATRGKWMEAMAQAAWPADKKNHDLAFMVGILSLLDVLLAMPMRDIVGGLPLADEAKSALLSRTGPMGALLRLIELKEANDFDAVTRTLQTMPFLTLARFTSAELDAARWANTIAAK